MQRFPKLSRLASWNVAAALIALALFAVPSDAQRRGFRGFGGGGGCSPQGSTGGPNIPYDGRFTMVRMWFQGGSGWCFDYPDMERNFVLILREISVLRPVMGASNVLSFDDPELFKYPMVYVSEPGQWYYTSDAELRGMRTYMEKGGFIFFDDFMLNEWYTFEAVFRKAIPNAEFFRLDEQHPIFDTFYKIQDIRLQYPNTGGSGLTAEFYGVFQDNDPSKHMMAVISFNSDLGDYMEWSGTGRNPINLANEAYKFAVNFTVYALTR